MTVAPVLHRDLLAAAFPGQPRLVSAFEDQALAVQETAQASADTVEATSAIQDATVLTLSANDVFTNERIFIPGDGLDLDDDGSNVTLNLTNDVARASGGYLVTLVPPGDCTLFLPLSGTLATRSGVETLSNKTLSAPKLSAISDYADDTAAASGGVPVGGVYRTGSALKIRVA